MSKILLAFIVLVFTSANVVARDQIKIVGSSTVFPFATVAAGRFWRPNGFQNSCY